MAIKGAMRTSLTWNFSGRDECGKANGDDGRHAASRLSGKSLTRIARDELAAIQSRLVISRMPMLRC
jgi:hypothetical protein